MHEALNHVVFISLPSSMGKKIGSFTIDPAIQLPVALADGSTTVDEQSISIERIISGMLKILAYDTEHPHTQYYRVSCLAQPMRWRATIAAIIAKKETLPAPKNCSHRLPPQSPTRYLYQHNTLCGRRRPACEQGRNHDFYQRKR